MKQLAILQPKCIETTNINQVITTKMFADPNLEETCIEEEMHQMPASTMFIVDERTASPDAQLVATCENLIRDNQQLSERINALEIERNNLEEQLSILCASKSAAEQALEQFDASYSALKSFQMHETDLLQVMAIDSSQKLINIQLEVDILQMNNNQLLNQIETINKQYTDALSTNQEQIHNLELENEKYQLELKNYIDIQLKYKEEMNNLELEKEKYRLESVNFGIKVDDLEQKLNNIDQDRRNRETELQWELEIKDDRNRELEEQLTTIQTYRNELSERVNSLEVDKISLESEIALLSASKSEVERALIECETNYSSLKSSQLHETDLLQVMAINSAQKLTNLEVEVDALRMTNSQLLDKIESIKKQLADALLSNESIRNSNDLIYNEKMNNLELEKEKYRLELINFGTKIDKIKLEYDEQIHNLEMEKEKYRLESVNFGIKVDQLELELSKIDQDCQNRSNELQHELNMNRELKEQLQLLTTAQNHEIDRINELEVERTSLTEQIALLTASKSTVERELVECQSNYSTQLQEIDRLQTIIVDSSQKITNLEDEINSLRMNNNRLSNECDQADQMEEEYVKRVQELLIEIESTKKQLTDLHESMRNTNQNSMNYEQIHNLELEKEKYRLESVNFGMKIGGLERQLRNMDRDYRIRETELQRELDIKDERNRQLKDQLRSLTTAQTQENVRRPIVSRSASIRSIDGGTDVPSITSDGGLSIVDQYLLNDERRKNYQMQKRIRDLEKMIESLKTTNKEDIIDNQDDKFVVPTDDKKSSIVVEPIIAKENLNISSSTATPDAKRPRFGAFLRNNKSTSTPSPMSVKKSNDKTIESPSNCRAQ